MTENRRQFSRIHFATDARLFLQGTQYPAEILDLSLKGALIRPVEALPPSDGAHAVLQIRLDHQGTSIRMEGHISHHEASHYGFTCREIDLDSITHLRRLVELNLGDASLLERELSHLLAE